MNESQRRNKLLDHLSEYRSISINQYVEQFGVSRSTALRDIRLLASEGKLIQVRNGAEAVANDDDGSDSMRPASFIPKEAEIVNLGEKRRIAKAAAKLCDESDSIILTGSNTTYLMFEHLANRNIHIVTNYMPLVYKLIEAKHENIVIVGGQYLQERDITISTDAEKHKNDYKGRYTFFTGSSLSSDGVHTADFLVYMATKNMLSYGDKAIALIDSTKVGKHVGKILARASEIDTIITGKEADSGTINQLKENGVNIIQV